MGENMKKSSTFCGDRCASGGGAVPKLCRNCAKLGLQAELTDILYSTAAEAVPIGLIETAVGGTQIEGTSQLRHHFFSSHHFSSSHLIPLFIPAAPPHVRDRLYLATMLIGS